MKSKISNLLVPANLVRASIFFRRSDTTLLQAAEGKMNTALSALDYKYKALLLFFFQVAVRVNESDKLRHF